MAHDANHLALYRRAAKIESYRRDYRRFAAEQQYIRTEEGTVLRFDLRYPQVLIEEVIRKQWEEFGWIRLVEFKCRQHGGSTHGVSRATHRAFLNENVSALILAQDDTTASNLFDMGQLMYEAMDQDIRPVRRYLTKQEIVLENPDPKTRPDYPGLRSRIAIQFAKNIHAGVGTTRNWLHISEMCRVVKVKELMGSLVPAIPLAPNTAIINESAPFGYGEGRDSFRALCDAAKSGKSPYHFVGIYWWMLQKYQLPITKADQPFKLTMEERRLINRVKQVSKTELGKEHMLSNEQLKFRRIRVQELGQGDDTIGEQLFLQQFPHDYDSGWVTFVNLVFEPYKMETMRKRWEEGPHRRCDIINDEVIDLQTNAPLWIWADPEPGEMYDMGVDTGQGTGGNASAFQVFKRSTNEQVAEYQNNKIQPLDYAKVCYSVGLYYNGAHLGVEVEGIGYAVNEALNQMGYPNIYRWRKRDHAGGGILSPLTGWKTQYDTKRLLVAVAQDVVSHDAVVIRSARLYNELRYFCQDFSDAGNEVFYASEGDDDLSMSFLITQTIMRDEKFIELPMERGMQLDRAPTLAERNAIMAKALENHRGSVDNPEIELRDRTVSDPWERLEAAMKGRDA